MCMMSCDGILLVFYLPTFADVDRSLNLLWMPENLSKCHSDYKDAFEMTEAEKLLILGMFL